MRTPTLFVLIALLCISSTPAEALTRIIHQSGEVTVNHQAPAKDAHLKENDLITAGPGATAVIEFQDGSQFKLREKTSVRLLETEPGKIEALLIAGGLFSKAAPVPKGGSFRVRTRSATMGVRGTVFFTAYGKDTDVWMCVNEGKVQVEAAGKQTLVPAGQGVFVKESSGISRPRPFEWTKGLNWNFDPSKGTVKDSSDLESAYGNLLQKNYD